ncbi:sensor histidine kinase [bacterium]|nr:sensor histidine kinase [bacterium]MBU1072579.1 sensor histidine kinase [bacterium]MBU1675593.1 sensor histidine kinase [bacterium]
MNLERPTRNAEEGLAAGLLIVGAMIALVSFLHYNTAVHIHEAHGIFRRLYYFPIVVAALRWGWRGGLGAAALICALYIPHAFGYIGFDPAATFEKVLEMVLYLAIGMLTGLLADRRRRALRAEAAAADGLRLALADKAAMEAELVRSVRLAAVGRLSAGLAHEIRNPLASIKGASDILADDVPAGDPKARLFEILQGESARLDGVLTRFLDYARPRETRRDPVDLAAETAEVLELLRHEPVSARLSLSAPDGCGTVIRGDRERLRQLLLNLVINASQAAAGGRVQVSLSRRNGRMLLDVVDDGPGFAPEALQQLGTPFFSTREGGTGLGLAVCLRIAEDHGGTLTAANVPGGGARVTVELPADEGEG